MGLDGELEMMDRLAAYLGELTTVVGHAGRVRPLMAYCAGLLDAGPAQCGDDGGGDEAGMRSRAAPEPHAHRRRFRVAG